MDPEYMGGPEPGETPSEEVSAFNTPTWTPDMGQDGEIIYEEEGYGGEGGYEGEEGYEEKDGDDERGFDV